MSNKPDQDSFEQGLIALLPRLRRQARSLTGNASSAEDLVQATCLEALELRSDFAPFGTMPYLASLGSWTNVILRNTHMDEEGRAARLNAILDGTQAEPVIRQRQDDTVALKEAVRKMCKLTQVQKATLSRVVFHGDSIPDIASDTEIPLGTVKMRVWRGRQNLRDLLGHQAAAKPGSALYNAQRQPVRH